MTQSICPKCGQEGTQSIQSDAKGSSRRYLVFLHKTPMGYRRCYIGRVRTTDEAMSEFEKEPTKDQYVKALEGISGGIRSLIKSYSPNTAVRMNVISKKLADILGKYGY